MSTGKAPSGAYWPWLIGAFLLLILTINIAVFVAATGDPGHVIVDDYYTKAVNWDARAAQKAHSRELGWQARLSFRPVPQDWSGPGDENPNTLVHLALLDSTGLLIKDAGLKLQCFHNARSANVFEAQLASMDDGYGAAFRLGPAGIWQFLLEATSGEELFLWEEERELGAVK